MALLAKPAVEGSAVRVLVLGAGRPLAGGQHPALRSANGRNRVFDWMRQSVAGLRAPLQFVGGYQLDEIVREYPDLDYQVNPEWATTGAAMSLLGAQLDERCTYYVSYADIVFRDSLTQRMEETTADVVVAADTRWRSRFAGRTDADLARCEKLTLSEDVATRLGPDLDPAFADAEFVGLARFSPAAVAFLKTHAAGLAAKLRPARLSELIEHLRVRGMRVRAVDVSGDWAELNEPQDLARFVLGTKAQTLQRLQGLVRLSRIEDQVSFTVSEWTQDAAATLARVREAFAGRRLVVRSSALSEDSFESANAGAYDSHLDVDGDDDEAVRRAIAGVAGSYPDQNPENQVLVQPMVAGVAMAGVVFTRTLTGGSPYYIVNYDDVTRSTDSITGGTSREHKTLVVHRACDFETDGAGVPLPLRSLMAAVREIEELLSFDALDVEFAITDDGVVRILQVRPIAASPAQRDVGDEAIAAALGEARARFRELQRPSPFVHGARTIFGVMPDWNPAEIVGTKPGRLASTLYRHLILDDVWATQRAEYGYRDVRPQPLLADFAGHPYVDVRASFNSFVPAALPDELAARLVAFYLDWLESHPHLHDKVEFDVVPTCFDMDFVRWSERLAESGRFRPGESEALGDALRDITRGAFDRPAEDLGRVHSLTQRFARIQAQPLAPLERARLLLEDCRRYGTLPFAHLARGAFVAVTLLKSAVRTGAIDARAMDAFLKSVRTVTHDFTRDAARTRSGDLGWEHFVRRYGHLRPGTYDITSLTYADDPERYLRPIVERAEAEHDEPDLEAWTGARPAFARALAAAGLSDDVEHVEQFMRSAIEGREYAKFAFSRNLSAALDCFAGFGATLGLGREDLMHVPLCDFLAVGSGLVDRAAAPAWLRERAEEGRRAHRIAAGTELPPLLLREGDFVAFDQPSTEPNFVGLGRVTGRGVDLSAGGASTPPALAGAIALIPQADPGYDWLFGQGIGGLVTMYGGANSHMAIRAAEFGLPAAIGVGEARYARLVRGTLLELDAGRRQIRVLQ